VERLEIMINKISKLVFFILFVLILNVLLSGCIANKSNIDKQPLYTSINTELSEEERNLLGMWHAMPNVAAGYAERFWFDEDRNYKFIPNSMDDTQDTDFGEGKWYIKENRLYLLQNENGNTDRIYSDNEIELEIGNIEKDDENIAYPYKIKIGEKYFWKIGESNTEVAGDSKSENIKLNNETEISKNINTLYKSNTGNINNGGLFGLSGEWVIFQSSEDGNKLYKIKTDGTEKQKISDDIATNIVVCGEWIFYIEKNSEKLFKIKIDGTNRSMLVDYAVYDMRVNGDWIYYLNCSNDKFSLYRIKANGTDEMKIYDGIVSCYDISENWIYLYDLKNGKLMKIKDDGSEMIDISEEESRNLIVQNDWIYYWNPNDNCSIYKMKTDGTQKEKICNDRSTRINVQGEWIYYIDSIYNINKIKIDGTEKIKLNDQTSENLHIFDKYILFSVDISEGNSPGNPIFNHFIMNLDGTEKRPLE